MPPSVAAVVVTYEPDVRATTALLDALVPQVEHTVVVDNGSEPSLVAGLHEHVAGLAGAVEVISLQENSGIARAQNIGIARAQEVGADLVLLSDQDSIPAADMVARLVDGMERASRRSTPVAAVGPVTVDDRAEGATLLFEARRWGPRRAAVPDADGSLVPVAFLIASGCLVTMDALETVGPMNDAWFIDHIDLEWGLRAKRAGYSLFGVGGAHLGHRLGDHMVALPGRERAVHIHSPVRNYYMARNTVLLMRSGLLPRQWWWGYFFWIVKYAVFYAAVISPRRRRMRLLTRGFSDGIKGRAGRLADE